MAFSDQEGLAIAELCVYIPTLFLAAILVFRLGYRRQLGWVFLAVFALVRVVGAIFELLREHNPTNRTDIEWAMILRSVGLSPLIMASMGLLKRVIDETSTRVPSDPNSTGNVIMAQLTSNLLIANKLFGKATAVSRRSRLLQILYLPTLIGLILCISGGTDEASTNPSDQSKGPSQFKAGIIIFIIMYVVLLLLTLVSVSEFGRTAAEPRRILMGVVVAMPLLGVRVIYSILTVFHNSGNFSQQNPNVWAEVGMATVEEFLVTLIYIAIGYTVRKVALESFDRENYYKQQAMGPGPGYQNQDYDYYPQQQPNYYPPQQQPAYMPGPPHGGRRGRDDGRW